MECRHCGKCCGIESSINVNLTVGDIWRMCYFLKISVEDFFEKYAGLKPFKDPRHPELYDMDLGLNMPCCFRKNKRCSAYNARPLNCRIFPYWVFVVVPEEKLKGVLKDYKCKPDPACRGIYKKYYQMLAKILLEEAEWLRLSRQIRKDEKALIRVPVEEVKELIARKLFKIQKNSQRLEKAEKILQAGCLGG